MAHQHDIKRLSQFSTAEEYARPFISFLFQPIISHSDDIFRIRRGHDDHAFCNSIGRCRDRGGRSSDQWVKPIFLIRYGF